MGLPGVPYTPSWTPNTSASPVLQARAGALRLVLVVVGQKMIAGIRAPLGQALLLPSVLAPLGVATNGHPLLPVTRVRVLTIPGPTASGGASRVLRLRAGAAQRRSAAAPVRVEAMVSRETIGPTTVSTVTFLTAGRQARPACPRATPRTRLGAWAPAVGARCIPLPTPFRRVGVGAGVAERRRATVLVQLRLLGLKASGHTAGVTPRLPGRATAGQTTHEGTPPVVLRPGVVP